MVLPWTFTNRNWSACRDRFWSCRLIADWPRYGVALLAALFSIVALLAVVRRYLKTGLVPYQRTYRGAPVTRRETPIFFWIHVSIFIALMAGPAWFAVHVTGYIFGLWGWSLEL
jgi:peptidoglycan biosynthesis protein MviN/MurJ (putative lipid II flippase)